MRRNRCKLATGIKNLASVLLMSSMLYGCSGGCGGSSNDASAQGCGGISSLDDSVGTERVDEGIRFRTNQLLLNFIKDNIGPILRGALGDNLDISGGWLRIPFGQQQPVVLTSSQWADVSLGRDIDDQDEVYDSNVLIGIDAIENNIDVRFVAAGDTVVTQAGETLTANASGLFVEFFEVPIGIDSRLYFRTEPFGLPLSDIACDIYGANPEVCPPSTGGACGGITQSTISMIIYPDVDSGATCDLGQGECLRLSIEFGGLDLGSLNRNAFEMEQPLPCREFPNEPYCTDLCTDGLTSGYPNNECQTACNVSELVLDVMVGILGTVENIVDDFLGDIMNLVIRRALDGIDGAPLSLAQRISLSDTVPTLFGPTVNDIGLNVTPMGDAFSVNCTGGNCDEAKGMDVILGSQFAAIEKGEGNLEMRPTIHPCVPELSASEFLQLYESADFNVVRSPALDGNYNGDAYAVGASIAEPVLNQAFFAAYNSGALCLEFDSNAIYGLSNGGVVLNTRLLDTFFPEANVRRFSEAESPVLITLSPSEPALMQLGQGTPEDPHLSFSWHNVQISFYYHVFDRFARVAAIDVDLVTGLNVIINPENEKQLILSLAQPPEFTRIEQVYNELLNEVNSDGEPIVDFGGTLSDIVGELLGSLLAGNFEIDVDLAAAIQSSLGIEADASLAAIETRNAGGTTFLNVYVDIEEDSSSTRVASDTPTQLPEGIALRRIERNLLRPVLDHEGYWSLGADDLEHLSFNDGDSLLVRRGQSGWRGPIIVQEGTLRVKQGLNNEPTEFTIVNLNSKKSTAMMVAPMLSGAPRISLRQSDDGSVYVRTPDSAVLDEIEWRIDDGEWFTRSDSRFRATEARGINSIEVRRRDVRGISRTHKLILGKNDKP